MQARRIIFLDIDGVLNSVRYDRQRTESDGNIDETRLVLLRALVDATGAELVLSSSWRKHLTPHPVTARDAVGEELLRVFASNGLTLADVTPTLSSGDRAEEIGEWLSAHADGATRYAVLDDAFGGWGTLTPCVVRTNARIGRGLEQQHAEQVAAILRS